MTTPRKPQRLDRTVVYESPWVNLYVDHVRWPSGSVVERHHLLDFEHEGVVMLIEDDLQRLALVQVNRYTTGKTEWELPAGGIEAGESIIDAASREALEETGLRTTHHRILLAFFPSNGLSNHRAHLVYCKAQGDELRILDTDEVCAVQWFTQDRLDLMLTSNEFSDGFSLVGLLTYFRSMAT